MMEAYCQVVKLHNPQIRYLICLATRPGPPGTRRSEDLMSFDFSGWTPEDDRRAEHLQRELDVLTDATPRSLFEPPVTHRGARKVNRRERRKAILAR
jgi:hypothetical protein